MSIVFEFFSCVFHIIRIVSVVLEGIYHSQECTLFGTVLVFVSN